MALNNIKQTLKIIKQENIMIRGYQWNQYL